MPYSLIICEDNAKQLQNITTIITHYSMFHDYLFPIELSTQTPTEVLDLIHEKAKEDRIYFLDIDLNHEVDGLNLAVEIRKLEPQAKIIFTTTHDELAHQTFKLKIEATGFIIKDQSIEEYRDEIHDVLQTIDDRNGKKKVLEGKRFMFKTGSETNIVDFDSVLYIATSSIPHRLELITKNERFEFYGKIKDIETRYPKLFKTTRAFLINPKNIAKINYKNREVLLEGDVVVPFSIGRGKALKQIEKQLR